MGSNVQSERRSIGAGGQPGRAEAEPPPKPPQSAEPTASGGAGGGGERPRVSDELAPGGRRVGRPRTRRVRPRPVVIDRAWVLPPLSRRRPTPHILVDVVKRMRADEGWYAMVGRGGRRELWIGGMEPGVGCMAAVDPRGRGVVWFGRVPEERPTEESVAEACLPGSGDLWRTSGAARSSEAWERIRRAHSLAVLAVAAGLDPELLADTVGAEPGVVGVAIDAWLEGNEAAAVGAIRGPVILQAVTAEPGGGAGDS